VHVCLVSGGGVADSVVSSVEGKFVVSGAVAEHGGEEVGVLDVREVPAVGEHCQSPVGQEVDRGLGMVRGEQIVGCAPVHEGGRGDGGKLVEQDLTLAGGVVAKVAAGGAEDGVRGYGD
jgi:hypothetical protein